MLRGRNQPAPAERAAPTLCRMTWLIYALATVALWTGWSFLSKVALKSVPPLQAAVLFGIAAAAISAATLALGDRAVSWSPSALWLASLSAVFGATGTVTFYVALERGKASLVAPVIGIYPAIVALLSVAFLSERLSPVQAVGVTLAVAGVVLIGTGG